MRKILEQYTYIEFDRKVSIVNRLEKLVEQKKALEAEIALEKKLNKSQQASEYFIRNCRFSFKCNQHWEGLEDQGIEDIKYCNSCGQEVFLCTTKENVVDAIRDNLCIALPITLRGKKEFLLGSIAPLKWLR